MGQIKNIKLHIVTDIKWKYSIQFPDNNNRNNNNNVRMDQITTAMEPAKEFVKDSFRLVKRCTKPDRREFRKIAMATAIGFAIMGFIGFFVKLIHIPINNIIVQ